MPHNPPTFKAYLRRSWLVYLWAIGSVAWLIHAGQNVARHATVLFDASVGEAAEIIAITVVDIARPPLVGAALLLPLVAIAFWCQWRRR